MKIEPVAKLDKRNKVMSKEFYNDVMSVTYDVIISFQIFGQSREIEKPDFRQWFVILTFLS